jgi:monoamine oxidase
MTDIIIIIGAGAAGLSAAEILSKKGYSIIVLEARERVGGRIHTLTDQGFSVPVEAGAEFIHGELPLTMELMKATNASWQEGRGRAWHVKEGKVAEGGMFDDAWDELMQKMEKIPHDMSMAEFLDKNFSEARYQSLKDSVKRFVQGYDAADIHKVSTKALYEEWSGEDIKGYRPVGGYAQLMNFLVNECQQHGTRIKLSSRVKKIQWRDGHVEVQTDKETFTGKKVIITIPVNVLKANHVQFDPPIVNHMDAISKLETGGVIKFLFEFKDEFWERKNESPFRKMPGLNFLFSDAFIPTWWTQKPSSTPLLTGWLAGPVINTIQQDDATLLTKGFETLAYLFNCKVDDLQKEIRTAKVINWATDPFSLGAYAYKTLNTSDQLKIISTPVDNTIYFAGEALYDGPEMGTVEAALASGKSIAEKISL